ncbi:hypothetical protein BGX30_015295 [Mortierella sp. GBA39]|nr:hypothetical protein BGX30_015295 [Mortierella sp. GBA39]
MANSTARGSGEIVEVGSEVQDFKVGGRVAFLGQDTYSDYAVVDAVHLAELPERASLKTAVQRGDWIVVHATAGGVGLLLSQLGRLLGAHVIGTVSTEEKATPCSRQRRRTRQLKVAIYKVYPVEDVQLAHLDLEGRKTTGKILLKIH